MTSTRSSRQLGTRRLALATVGLVSVTGAAVAGLVAHDASQAHGSTPTTTSNTSGSTSNPSSTSNLSGTSSQSSQSSTPDATSGGS